MWKLNPYSQAVKGMEWEGLAACQVPRRKKTNQVKSATLFFFFFIWNYKKEREIESDMKTKGDVTRNGESLRIYEGAFDIKFGKGKTNIYAGTEVI